MNREGDIEGKVGTHGSCVRDRIRRGDIEGKVGTQGHCVRERTETTQC